MKKIVFFQIFFTTTNYKMALIDSKMLGVLFSIAVKSI